MRCDLAIVIYYYPYFHFYSFVFIFVCVLMTAVYYIVILNRLFSSVQSQCRSVVMETLGWDYICQNKIKLIDKRMKELYGKALFEIRCQSLGQCI